LSIDLAQTLIRICYLAPVSYSSHVVTMKDGFSADNITTELGDSFTGLPVDVDYISGLYTLQGGYPGGSRGGGGGRSGLVQGGISIMCREQGTIFAVLQGVSTPSQKYVVTSSHVVQVGSCSVGGRQIGRMAKDARPCNGGKVYLDAASVLLNQGVQSSPNILQLGGPKRL
jgi:hypothetical protein